MKLKTVDLELLPTFSYLWKILVWLLLFVFWFVNALLSLESFICMSSEYLIIFITITGLKIWIRNAPMHNPFDCIIIIIIFLTNHLIVLLLF